MFAASGFVVHLSVWKSEGRRVKWKVSRVWRRGEGMTCAKSKLYMELGVFSSCNTFFVDCLLLADSTWMSKEVGKVTNVLALLVCS